MQPAAGRRSGRPCRTRTFVLVRRPFARSCGVSRAGAACRRRHAGPSESHERGLLPHGPARDLHRRDIGAGRAQVDRAGQGVRLEQSSPASPGRRWFWEPSHPDSSLARASRPGRRGATGRYRASRLPGSPKTVVWRPHKVSTPSRKQAPPGTPGGVESGPNGGRTLCIFSRRKRARRVDTGSMRSRCGVDPQVGATLRAPCPSLLRCSAVSAAPSSPASPSGPPSPPWGGGRWLPSGSPSWLSPRPGSGRAPASSSASSPATPTSRPCCPGRGCMSEPSPGSPWLPCKRSTSPSSGSSARSSSGPRPVRRRGSGRWPSPSPGWPTSGPAGTRRSVASPGAASPSARQTGPSRGSPRSVVPPP